MLNRTRITQIRQIDWMFFSLCSFASPLCNSVAQFGRVPDYSTKVLKEGTEVHEVFVSHPIQLRVSARSASSVFQLSDYATS